MVITTSSGSRYHYDMHSNEISIDAEEKNPFFRPVQFGAIETVTSLPNIDTFILELTRDCNFRCSYCCYSGKYDGARSHSSVAMTKSTIDEAIHFIANARVKDKGLNIVFYGGEPLLRFNLIQYFLKKGTNVFPDDTSYSISTNGSLLSDEIISWVVENNISLNLSYDVLEQSGRRYKNGTPSQTDVDKIIQLISRVFPKYWETKVDLLVTFSDISQLLEIAKAWGCNAILRGKAPHLISGVAPCTIGDYSIDEDRILMTLRNLMDYYSHNRENIFIKTYFEQLCSTVVDRQVYELPDNYSPLVCLPNNARCFIDAEGAIGICEKTSDNLRLGNIQVGWDYGRINQAVNELARERIDRCGNCEYFRLCKTCFTNYFYDSERWNADCQWQQKWNRIILTLSLEILEEELFDSPDIEAISLREITEADISSLHRIMSKSRVVKYIDGLDIFKGYEDSLRFYLLISEINCNFARPSLLAIVDEMSDLIGVVGIDEITDDAANLFFLLEDDYWGKGIMTKILAEYLQKHVPNTVKTIKTHINPENKAALRLASKFSKIEVSTSANN